MFAPPMFFPNVQQFHEKFKKYIDKYANADNKNKMFISF